MADPRVTKLAQLLVDYSTKIQPGEKVHINGNPFTEPLVTAVYQQVLKRGGYPFIQMAIAGEREILYRLANDDQLAYVDPVLSMIVETFDVLINCAGSGNTREFSNVDPARQAKHAREARRPILETVARRSAEGELRWVRTQFPTNANAQDADMSLHDYQNFVYTACHVNQDDDPVAYWQAFSQRQQKLIDWLKGRDRVTVKGPNVDLTLSIKDRTFMNADGTINMPDGEIYTGPVEDSVNGWIKFTYPVISHGREITGIELEFQDGKVVKASAKRNQDFLLETLDIDPGARYLGEWAIGTNDGIQQFSKSILFDEKIGGTMHIALGRSYPETGGKNVSAIHWDIICDMKNGSEITIDGDLFYRNGQFTI